MADIIRSGNIKRIICLCGAGISVAAGIPDFRTKGTGLYDNLEKYNLPSPESVFDIEYFRENPKPFICLAKELLPGTYKPTTTHYFLKLLQDKGILLRVYTQNIDGLEFSAGLREDKVIQCHGGFQSSHCVDCNEPQDNDRIRADIIAGQETICDVCGGLCKPAITFFGERLSPRFYRTRAADFTRLSIKCCHKDCEEETTLLPDNSRGVFCDKHTSDAASLGVANTSISPSPASLSPGERINESDDISCACDLLLVLGTSLCVAPVSGLVDDVHWLVPRVLMNREAVHLYSGDKDDWSQWPPKIGPDNGFRFNCDDNYRDVLCQMDCDDACRNLCALIGWENELDELVKNEEGSPGHA